MKIVSACLVGINCTYDGSSKPCQKVIELVKQGKAIPVCPEQLGGLTTPRLPSEKRRDKVFMQDGRDVTAEFKRGAEEALKIAKLAGCNEAVLKSKSPSCGCGRIYDGSFSRKLVKGNGVFTELLKKNKIKVVSDEDI
jgi:uncharacterized protein YbbK (DUF523 family)